MNMKSKSFESAVFFYLLSQQVLVISNHHKEKKRKSLYGQNIYTSFFGKLLKLIIECYFLRLKKWNDLIKSINSVKWHVYAFSDTECVFWLISNGKVPKPWQDPKHQWQMASNNQPPKLNIRNWSVLESNSSMNHSAKDILKVSHFEYISIWYEDNF